MSFKCSLLGHRWGEREVEREREEDGSEVVITITELETCSRCAETRVVSENKEVTTMATPDAGADATDDGGAGDAADTEEADADVDTGDAPDPEEDDAVILGEGEESAETGAQAQARGETTIPDAEGEATTVAADADEETGPPEDDAVILGEDDADEGTAEADDPDPEDATTEDAATEGEAVEADAGPDLDLSVVEEHPDDADRGPGEWPDEPDDADAGADAMGEWPEETTRDPADTEAVTSFEESASPTVTVPEGMFKCSECGFTTEVESSSLRAGDFCPECHTGTLVQHDDEE